MNRDDRLCRYDQEHDDDHEPLIAERELDLCKGISGKTIYDNAQDDQDRRV